MATIKEVAQAAGESVMTASRVARGMGCVKDSTKQAVLAAMQELRAVGDEIEALIGEGYLPYPTYGQLLFGV